MTPEVIISVLVGTIGCVIGVISYFKGNKKDAVIAATKNAAEIATIRERQEAMQSVVNQISVAELARMQQTMETLNDRVNRLDSDVENKLDKISEKMDTLFDRLGELSITLAKLSPQNQNNKDV